MQFDHKTAVPIQDLTSIDWSQAQAVSKSEQGNTSGVLFVQFSDNSAVVVKPDRNFASEAFASILAQFLQVPAPQVRLQNMKDDQGQALKTRLCEINSKKDMASRIDMKRALSQPFVLLMQYVKGAPLPVYSFNEETRFLWCETVFGPQGNLSEKGREQLRGLGSIAALDMLIHNPDRLPSLWDNLYNLYNVMVDKDMNFTAIDTTCGTYDHTNPRAAPQFEKYEARVQYLLDHVHDACDLPGEAMQRIAAIFRDGYGTEAEDSFCYAFNYDIGDEGVIEMQNGFKATCTRMKFLTKPILNAAYYSLKSVLQDDVDEHHAFGLECINVDFMARITEMIRDTWARKRRSVDIVKKSLGRTTSVFEQTRYHVTKTIGNKRVIKMNIDTGDQKVDISMADVAKELVKKLKLSLFQPSPTSDIRMMSDIGSMAPVPDPVHRALTTAGSMDLEEQEDRQTEMWLELTHVIESIGI